MHLAQGGRLVLCQPQPAGGTSGHKFDSGCNPQGVAKIRIECGERNWKGIRFLSCVKRVFLDFHKMVPSSSCPDAIYWGCGVHISNNKTFTFDLAPGDEIFKAVVWSEGMVVNALQFHTKLGYLSPVFGIPRDNAKTTEVGGEESASLVGIYGRFGAVIDSLGFTFASVATAPTMIGSSWIVQRMEEDSSTFPSSTGTPGSGV